MKKIQRDVFVVLLNTFRNATRSYYRSIQPINTKEPEFIYNCEKVNKNLTFISVYTRRYGYDTRDEIREVSELKKKVKDQTVCNVTQCC